MTPTPHSCPGCGTQIGPSLLACPACGRLWHADRLTELAGVARDAASRGETTAELAAWREALDLLPAHSRQHVTILEKVNRLSGQVDGLLPAAPASKVAAAAPKWLGGLGVAGLLLWKFKAVVLIVLTKGKLLLLGLTKSSTLFSMVASLGVYWTVFGWKFALGLILSIYIHEMGHVAALRRFGFKATAPMFIPGVGAIIRLQQHPANPREDARIGLAGPIWGLGAALASLAIWAVTKQPIFAAIGQVGAWINLFNLMPFFSLDGGRGFRPMTRVQKWLCVASLLIAWLLIHDGLLLLVLIVAAFRAAADKPDPAGDRIATAQYILLVAALCAIVRYAAVPAGG